MLMKDPFRFRIRNAHPKDCVKLYQLVKQCYLEVIENGEMKQSDRLNDANAVDENDLNNNNINDKNLISANLTERNVMSNTLMESFEEFVDCLGFGKKGLQRKVLDCLLIEDVNEQKIIALVTYSYGYFSYAGKEIHMNHFYVRREHRHNGFGRFLMKNLIKLAAQADLHKLKYDVPKSSKGFCRFMEKLGAKNFTQDVGYALFRIDLRTIESNLQK